MDARARITALAADLGFQTVRFARVGRAPHAEQLSDWLAAGMHADMGWLERTAEVRMDPRVRMPEARSVVVLGLGHAWRVPPDPGGRTGRVARYAWGRDYHNLIGKRLKKLGSALRSEGIQCFGGVDTAPVLERSWAVASGLGVLGKNALVFVPGTSSWGFLAVLVTDADVTPDTPVGRDHCGSCTRCLVACPTHAFAGPHRLDARRCISYWTIEAGTLAPAELLPGFGRWVFGCDVCQEVCPHNHHPPEPSEPDFLPRHAWLDLDELLQTPDDALMERFLGTPLRRPGVAGLKRNAAVALGNLGDDGAIPVLEAYGLAHSAPVVNEAARWAIARLS
ncbi:MAG: tRNA epoxyqueuosine(34) reductase QueG [Myxococcota bacterium]